MAGLGLRPRFWVGSLGDLIFASAGDLFFGGLGLFDGDLSFFCDCGVGTDVGLAVSSSSSSLSLSESRRVLLSRRRLLRFVVEFVS